MNIATLHALRADIAKVVGRILKWDSTGRRYTEVPVHPTIIERSLTLLVSAVDGKDFADYYGEYRGNVPYINRVLIAVAKKHGGYWEWENPGAIRFVEG